mgnify:FL=1
MELEVCLSPALYPAYRQENDRVIVVDVFRATTTICAAFANGARAIIPVAGIQDAERYKAQGFPVGAERNARKCYFADFGNSPFDVTAEKVGGKTIVFTTTNGTQAVEAAKDSAYLLIGAFSNIDVLMEKSIELGGRVVILCAGWNNRINIEDTLFAGAFAEKLIQKAVIRRLPDSVRIALHLWEKAKSDPLEFVKQTEHYQRLIANHAETDAPFCLQHNTCPVVPYYDKEKGWLSVF